MSIGHGMKKPSSGPSPVPEVEAARAALGEGWSHAIVVLVPYASPAPWTYRPIRLGRKQGTGCRREMSGADQGRQYVCRASEIPYLSLVGGSASMRGKAPLPPRPRPPSVSPIRWETWMIGGKGP